MRHHQTEARAGQKAKDFSKSLKLFLHIKVDFQEYRLTLASFPLFRAVCVQHAVAGVYTSEAREERGTRLLSPGTDTPWHQQNGAEQSRDSPEPS